MVFVIPVAIKVFYPIYFKMELTSCYEYLGIRFGKEIRVLGAILYVLQVSYSRKIFVNRQIATFTYTYVGIWYNFNNALILIFSDVFLHSRCCLGASHCPLQGNRFGHKNCSRLNICCVCFLLIARWHESSGHC